MANKRTDIPPELLSKEFLKQFKTEEDVSKFLKNLHSQVLEQMLQGEMDSYSGPYWTTILADTGPPFWCIPGHAIK